MRELYRDDRRSRRSRYSDVQLSESLNATLAAKPKGAGWWVFALWVAAVESAVPGRRNAAGDGARPASALLPVVARLARDARVPGPRARARSRRRVPRRRDAPARDARDRRAASPVAPRDGRRLVSSALGEGRRGRTRDRRADVRRPARPPAVRGTAVARQRSRRARATRAAPSARRSTTSSARASRSSRTASSTRTSNGWRPRSRHACRRAAPLDAAGRTPLAERAATSRRAGRRRR